MVRTIVGLFSLVSLLVAFLVTSQLVLAQEAKTSPSASLAPAVINSNELFWPLSAGKTINESLYFLKTFKENLRGWLIFGNSQKADYSVFLGTKRVLEAQKLLSENKKEMADQTFDRALEQFEIARKNIEEASSKKILSSDNVATMKPRLSNLINFLPTFASDKANEVLQKVSDLNDKL